MALKHLIRTNLCTCASDNNENYLRSYNFLKNLLLLLNLVHLSLVKS